MADEAFIPASDATPPPMAPVAAVPPPAPVASMGGGFGGGGGIPPAMAWDVAPQLREQWQQYYIAGERMAATIDHLQRAAEHTRVSYNKLVEERDALREQLASAEQRLADVQRIVGRYTVVNDPVVASDGFTYERRTIEQYLEDCASSGVPAVSQQTKEPLNATLVANMSLKKLVDLLKNIKPLELPPTSGGVASIAKVPTAPVAPSVVPGGGGMGPGPGAYGMHPGMGGHVDPRTIPGTGPNGERLHPCVRVYGFCNYKESCAYARYQYEACLSHLKGKCRFGQQCHELHINFKGPAGQFPLSPGGSDGMPKM